MNVVNKTVGKYNRKKNRKVVIIFVDTIAGKNFLEMLQCYLLVVINQILEL